MRISDWSSDVCSSDLVAEVGVVPGLVHLVERDVRMRPQAAVEHADLLEVRQHRERGVGAVAVAQGLEVRVHAAVQVDARLLGLDEETHVAEVGLEVERVVGTLRSEEHTSELQSLMRISYAVFCLKK